MKKYTGFLKDFSKRVFPKKFISPEKIHGVGKGFFSRVSQKSSSHLNKMPGFCTCFSLQNLSKTRQKAMNLFSKNQTIFSVTKNLRIRSKKHLSRSNFKNGQKFSFFVHKFGHNTINRATPGPVKKIEPRIKISSVDPEKNRIPG